MEIYDALMYMIQQLNTELEHDCEKVRGYKGLHEWGLRMVQNKLTSHAGDCTILTFRLCSQALRGWFFRRYEKSQSRKM